jgi:tetratricopeptide (TPR) repeat protein
MNENTMEFRDDMVSAGEEIDIIEAEYVGESILSKAGRLLFYGFVVLFPLWFLPTSLAPGDLNKAYFGALILIGSFMLTLGGILQEGKIRLVTSKFFLTYIIFLIAVLAAALFSAAPIGALWGIGTESFTFSSMLVGGLALFLVPLVIKEELELKKAFLLFGAPLFALFLFFMIQSVFNIDVFRAWPFAADRAFNPFGSWNALALFFGFGIALSLPFMGGVSVALRRLAAVIFASSFVGAFFTNAAIVWIAVAVVSLFFVALALSQREQRSSVFAVSLFLLLASVLLVLLNTTLSTTFSGSSSSFGRPQEVIPSFSSTRDIVQKTFGESALFGSGPNSFGLSWERFKSADINTTIFWQTRFPSGVSSFLTLLAETGLAGGVVWLILSLWFIVSGIRALGRIEGMESSYVRASFAGGLYLLLLFFLASLSFPLIFIMLVMMGFFFTSLSFAGVLPPKNIYLFETKEKGFAFSLLIIFLLVAGVGGLYYETTRYLGAIAYGRGLGIFTRDGSVNGAEKEIEKAISLDGAQDRYWKSVAEFEFIKIQRVMSDQSTPQEERATRFRDAYNKGRASALRAIQLAANEPQNYLALGHIYEIAIPQDTSVADLALENYEKARKLAPSDPTILVALARTHLAVADVTLLRGGGSASQKIAADRREKAIPLLTEAVKLKPDYTQAYFTLSQVYVVENQIDKAITNAEATSQLLPNHIGVLFQLGILHYQKQNFDTAEQVLFRSVEINPNYSNARYFLGLIYDRKNESAKALEQFRAIEVLNPTNEEVSRIVAALEAGKKASDVLSNPPPEDRKDLPLTDIEKEVKTPPKEVPGL